jgi:hypothetical protein
MTISIMDLVNDRRPARKAPPMNQNNERRSDMIEAEKPENGAVAPAPRSPSERAGKPHADIAVDIPKGAETVRKEPDQSAQPGAAVPARP